MPVVVAKTAITLKFIDCYMSAVCLGKVMRNLYPLQLKKHKWPFKSTYKKNRQGSLAG